MMKESRESVQSISLDEDDDDGDDDETELNKILNNKKFQVK